VLGEQIARQVTAADQTSAPSISSASKAKQKDSSGPSRFRAGADAAVTYCLVVSIGIYFRPFAGHRGLESILFF
jgi:hypothetical protein